MISISNKKMKHWNVGLTLEDIAEAYEKNNRLDSNCFIFFDSYVTPLNISDLRLVDDALHLTLNAIKDLPKNVSKVDVVNGHLIAYLGTGQERVVNVGRVVGNDGISPTFTIENGHLFADYDNPYINS